MYYLYGSKSDVPQTLVATFDSEQQLLAYIGWATLSKKDGLSKFEQGTPLARYQSWTSSKKNQI